MVNSYTNTSVAVASSEAIPFVNNRYIVGCGNSHAAGSPAIVLRKPGYYLVNFNGVLSAALTGTVSAQLYDNGVAVPGATSSATIATAGDLTNISFSSVVKVLESCACVDNTTNLTIVNTGLASTYSDAEISIIRLN